MRKSVRYKRVELTRPLRKPGEEARLRQVQRRGRSPEIRLRGRLDTKRLVAVEDRVQVHLQDLVFGVLPLQLDRKDQLARLAVEAPAAGGVGEQVVLDQLLRDSAPALGRSLVQDVVDTGCHQTDGIDGAMVVEVAVLDGDR